MENQNTSILSDCCNLGASTSVCTQTQLDSWRVSVFYDYLDFSSSYTCVTIDYRINASQVINISASIYMKENARVIMKHNNDIIDIENHVEKNICNIHELLRNFTVRMCGIHSKKMMSARNRTGVYIEEDSGTCTDPTLISLIDKTADIFKQIIISGELVFPSMQNKIKSASN